MKYPFKTKEEKIDRWAKKSAAGLDAKGVRKVFTTKRERESEKIDRIIYGGDSSQAKLDYCKNLGIFFTRCEIETRPGPATIIESVTANITKSHSHPPCEIKNPFSHLM